MWILHTDTVDTVPRMLCACMCIGISNNIILRQYLIIIRGIK